MTEQPNFEEQLLRHSEATPSRDLRSARPGERRTNAQAIAAGLEYLLSQRRGRHWGPIGCEHHLTASVLARLGELPSQYLHHSLRRQMLESVDWLSQKRTPDGGWGSPLTGDDAETTAWAVIALRRHGYSAPEQALNLMRKCRRRDGGFARSPRTIGTQAEPSSPEVTAIVVRALGAMYDGATEDFLAAFLHRAASSISERLASSVSVCAEILDCETGIASPLLLSQAARVAAQLDRNNAGSLEPALQALLLRCQLRLRNQKAWPLAAGLRAMQMEDGSWNGCSLFLSNDARVRVDDTKIITTATSVSALVLAEFQPGLYFGSDLPLPRRLQES